MKVSVKIITYNHEKFIAQAIDSALMQQVNFDYEIVIGEDCSTDKTRAIVIGYQKRYPDRIRLLLPEKNLGMHRNSAQTLQACQGDYIAMLEGDDYWTSPHKLQRQVDFLDSHPECAMCFHNVTVFDEDGSREPRSYSPDDQKRISTLEDLLTGDFIPTCSTMIRRGLFGELPDWYYAVPVGDWPLHILCAQHGKIGYINEVMAAYRVHSGGVWSGASRAMQLHMDLRVYEEIGAHLSPRYKRTIEAGISRSYYGLAVENYLAGSEELATELIHTQIERYGGVSRLWQEHAIDAARRIEARDGHNAAVTFIQFACDATKAQPGARRWARQLWGEWHEEHAFQAHQAGDRAAARRAVWQAVRYDRELLGNRGLLFVLASAVIGLRLSDMIRRVVRHLFHNELRVDRTSSLVEEQE